jgi:hypothetical protein
VSPGASLKYSRIVAKALPYPVGSRSPRKKLRGFSLAASFYWVMNHNENKLNSLLKQWRDIEPSANFEANVRRRIRLATAETPERAAWMELLQRLTRQPAFSMAAAVVVGLIVGAWGGIKSAPPGTNRADVELQFLSSGTLAGSYVSLTTEERR